MPDRSDRQAADIGLVDRLVEPGGAIEAAPILAGAIANAAGATAMKRAFLTAQPVLFTNMEAGS